jgi:methyltransferase (TIGR00027 family)
MIDNKNTCPSRTAYGAAINRAVHQILDVPLILDDSIALRIIEPNELVELQANLGHYQTQEALYLRAFIVMRSRYTEDILAQSIQTGTSQYVILGAGLDTFAYRNPYPESVLNVFEVDQPNMQSWKRKHLRMMGISIPKPLTYVPINFETERLGQALQVKNFKADKTTFFSWLGVTQYLTPNAVFETLKFVSSLPQSSEIVFEYVLSPSLLNSSQQKDLEETARRSSLGGEPWMSSFEPFVLMENLHELGFSYVDDFDSNKANEQYFKNRTDKLSIGGIARIMRARV